MTHATRHVNSAHVIGEDARIDKKMIQATARFSYIGIFFGVAVVICVFAGRWADNRWHTTPWLTVLGLLLGVATGFRELYRISKRALKDER